MIAMVKLSYYIWKWSKHFAGSFHIESAKWFQWWNFHIKYENEANILLIHSILNQLCDFSIFCISSWMKKK